MKNTLTADFDFEIGEIVTLKAMLDHPEPQKLHVIEQFAQRCHGGVQTQYRLRPVTTNRNVVAHFNMEYVMMASIELAIYPPASVLETNLRRTQAWNALASEAQMAEESFRAEMRRKMRKVGEERTEEG